MASNRSTFSTRLILEERNEEYESLEVWQREHRESLRLDNAGFSGDSDVPLLLGDMEDELTHDEAIRRFRLGIHDERHRYRGIPLSMATPEEARRARENDIDSMDHAAWDSET